MPTEFLRHQRHNFIAIDETLANSKLQWWVWLSVSTTLVLLIFALNLPLSHQMGMAVLLVICLILGQMLPYHPVTVSTLPLPYQSNKDGLGEVEWHLGVAQLDIANFFSPNLQESELWQAHLIEANFYYWVIVLKFWVDEPREHDLTVTIWQDQVSDGTWRQLAILAQV